MAVKERRGPGGGRTVELRGQALLRCKMPFILMSLAELLCISKTQFDKKLNRETMITITAVFIENFIICRSFAKHFSYIISH